MSEGAESRLGGVLRGVSRGVGVLLILWALADDPWIGGGPGFGFSQAALMGIGLLVLGSSFVSLAVNARVLALVLSVGFVLVIGEIGVRVLYSARYQRPFQLDETSLYQLVPNSVREFRRAAVNGGDRILYRVNSEGYRGEELESDPRLRIVVYGDSFIQGEFSFLEYTFTERLEDHLSTRLGFDVEVVNAGVAGYGVDQALRKMEGELEDLAPDLVVVAVFTGNDYGDMVRNKLFRIDDAGALHDNDFTIDPEQRRTMQVSSRELLLKRMLREAVHTLAVRLGFRDAPSSKVDQMDGRERLNFFREQHVLEYEEFVLQRNNVVHELAWDTYDADVSLTPESDSALYKARMMEAVIGRMQAATSSLSIPMVLLPIPHPIDVGGHDTGEIDSHRFPDYTPGGLVQILEEIAARRDLPVVDLFSPFSELGSELVYFQGFDDHWNDQGQDVAGEIVAEFLIRNELLDMNLPGTTGIDRAAER